MLLLGLVGALMVLGTPAHAQNYPWCAQYSGRALGGAQNCGFVSFAQCMATPASAASACKTRCISRRRIDIGKRKITDAWGRVAGVSVSAERSNLAAPY